MIARNQLFFVAKCLDWSVVSALVRSVWTAGTVQWRTVGKIDGVARRVGANLNFHANSFDGMNDGPAISRKITSLTRSTAQIVRTRTKRAHK